jgi:carboxymethylenebutenolidase
LIFANTILAACGPPTAGEASATTTAASRTVTGATSQGTSTAAAGVRVAPDNPAVKAKRVEFPGQGVTLIGYLARPGAGGTFPMVLVCHENRGLTDYIKDVTRRLAKAGYAALAVDLLSRQGGTDKVSDPAQVPGILGNTSPDQFIQDFRSGLSYLQGQSFANKDRVGMIGFCFGGGVTWRAATKIAELRAAVPFYGPNPPLQDVPAIHAAVLAIYGGLDQRIDQGIPEIEQAMQQNNKTFRKEVYAGAGHAFHNDTGPNYKPDAAKDAWAKALAWFDQYLKA